MISPCENCPTRKMYAKSFDIHFYGADCPYECEEYDIYEKEKMKAAFEHWKDEKEEDGKHD